MDLNSLILFFILISFGLFFYKYFVFFLNKYNSKLLVDDQFTKPQSFHVTATSVSGGTGIFFLFLILNLYLFATNNIIYYEYLSFCSLFFILGLSDDLKLNLKPKFRLLAMLFLLGTLVVANNFYIENTGISLLNRFLKIDIFSLFFICLCFLFIINGSNLIDGYNGLLGIHTLIILINLCLINYFGGKNDLAFYILCVIFILAIFLKYNFPKATIFLGDGGSYFLGTFIAISIIKTSIANPTVSPFYFCILLFYLFFEVFFSFIRKIFKERMSPLFPDKKHLHMLIYQNFIKRNKNKLKSNYYVSIVINMVYIMLIIPATFMMKNGLFCKYYSVLFFVIYLSVYKACLEKVK